jgi:putative ATP-dependent endonuclease of OLD family
VSQVLQHADQIRAAGNSYDPRINYDQDKLKELNVLGIGDLANALLKGQKGIVNARNKINKHLKNLALHDDRLESSIEVSGAKANDNVRLRQLLEKIELNLGGVGKVGLGSNNLLFMACELLLLAEEKDGNKMLLMEEPEAHLHAQRQLQVMKFMQTLARDNAIQIVVTTHSPNLASVIELDNMVMIRKGRAFSLANRQTKLGASDYRFLERFLDATKANLFFARGVMIVEGDSENILLPTLARLIGRDFTEHGVSIVNVGSVGLRRYARIFQREGVKEMEKDKQLDIPVACVTDMDVMPDCAPTIIGKVKEGEEWPEKSKRRWRAKMDIGDENALQAHRKEKAAKASGQCVKTFVSDEWTLEYDLALGPKDDNNTFLRGLGEDLFVAACLAHNDDDINAKRVTDVQVEKDAVRDFATIKTKAVQKDGSDAAEVLALNVYAKFAKEDVPKPIAAQYLAKRLELKNEKRELTPVDLRARLPKYLIEAIDYVCGLQDAQVATTSKEEEVSE